MGWDERVPELLAHLGALGLVGLVKIDGEREHKPWTVVISGQRLGEASIARKTLMIDVTDTELAVHCDDGTRTIRRTPTSPSPRSKPTDPARSTSMSRSTVKDQVGRIRQALTGTKH